MKFWLLDEPKQIDRIGYLYTYFYVFYREKRVNVSVNTFERCQLSERSPVGRGMHYSLLSGWSPELLSP